MTIAEQLEAKGDARGIQQGKQEATRQLARQLLSDRIVRENIKRYTGLSDTELDTL